MFAGLFMARRCRRSLLGLTLARNSALPCSYPYAVAILATTESSLARCGGVLISKNVRALGGTSWRRVEVLSQPVGGRAPAALTG